jgi:hypothetical protein
MATEGVERPFASTAVISSQKEAGLCPWVVLAQSLQYLDEAGKDGASVGQTLDA